MAVWLVDMGYVVGAGSHLFKIDYVKARRQITEKLGSEPFSIIFNSVDPKIPIPLGLQNFYTQMKQAKFQVKLYEMEGGRQRMVDVAIASQAVLASSRGHNVILTSGDIDFLPAIEVITKQIKGKVTLFTYDHGVHEKVIEAATDHWFFEDMRQRIEKLLGG